MKKLLLATSLCIFAASSHAHRVWVESTPLKAGEVLQADLGYGEFPTLETIPEKRLSFFEQGMHLLSAKGSEALKQSSDKNYHFVSQAPLAEGSYVISATYKPTFWSQNAEGWKQADMKNTPNATYCEQTSMYGKQIINVGKDSGVNVVADKVGHKLEIVPMVNPASVKVGEPFKVVVLYEGEPLPNATLTATFKGFDTQDHSHSHKVEAQAFSDTTGEDGTVNIIPLKDGFWKAAVVHEVPFSDPAQCQKSKHYASMTFDIAK